MIGNSFYPTFTDNVAYACGGAVICNGCRLKQRATLWSCVFYTITQVVVVGLISEVGTSVARRFAADEALVLL